MEFGFLAEKSVFLLISVKSHNHPSYKSGGLLLPCPSPRDNQLDFTKDALRALSPARFVFVDVNMFMGIFRPLLALLLTVTNSDF